MVMDAIWYLKSIRELNDEIKASIERIDMIRTSMCNIVAPTDNERVQSSGEMEKISLGVAKVVDLENDINEKIDMLAERKRMCNQCIIAIKNENYQEILWGKYYEGKSIYQLARELRILERSAKRAHKNALRQFSDIFNTKYGI